MTECEAVRQVIGGMFGLEEALLSDSSAPPFANDQSIFLINASSGINLFTELVSPCQVWMPSYLCASMLRAVERKRLPVRFYEVNGSLTISEFQWLSEVGQGDLVVLIDYFGFPHDKTCTSKLKKIGAWILEDASQALLSRDVGRSADSVIFSQRKKGDAAR